MNRKPERNRPGAVALAGATVTTGLMAGLFYAYAVSVSLGLAAQPDAAYVATMNEINARIQNPLFFLSFVLMRVWTKETKGSGQYCPVISEILSGEAYLHQ